MIRMYTLCGGKIKRRYSKNDTCVWTNEIAAKEAHCSKSNVKTIMRKLEKLGAITFIQKGKLVVLPNVQIFIVDKCD